MLPENEPHKQKLIERYINNEISEKEFRAFFGLLSTDELDTLLQANMDQEILEIRKDEYSVSRRTRLWPRIAGSRIAAAAAVLLVVGLSIFFFNRYNSAQRHPDLN